MASAVKKRIVDELAARFKGVEDLVVANFHGVSAKEMAEARRELKAGGMELEVVKVRLAKLALEKAGMGKVGGLLSGPSVVATGGEQGMLTLARSLANLEKKMGKVKVRGGYSGGVLLSLGQVERVSKITSVQGLRAQLVGALSGPVSGLAGVLQQVASSLVYTLDGIRKKQESSA